MGTTINPMIAGSPFDDEGPVEFPRGPSRTDIVRLLEAARNPKAILKAAEGTLNPPHSKPKKVTKPKAGKNLRAPASELKSKKRGPFGEKYAPVKAASKGVRVAESRRRRRLRSRSDSARQGRTG